MVSNIIAAHGAVYAQPGKGHDRLFLDPGNQFFAVLDGAGGDELSQAAVEALPTTLAKHTGVRQRSPEQFMQHVLSDIDCLPEGVLRKSTVAAACVDVLDNKLALTYAHAGDTSIYFWDKAADTFTRLANAPTSYIPHGDFMYIDVDEFLGNYRSPEQIAPLVGQLLLPQASEWSLLGLTDGVQDDNGQGLSHKSLEVLVRSTPLDELPDAALDAVVKYDDASLFIVGQ